MMAALHSGNRAMFWRIIRRLFGANRGRLFVMLLALGAGAAVTAALLNLQVDAKRRLTTEFRTFGPNVVISPRNSSDSLGFLNDALFDRIPNQNRFGSIPKAEFLYGVVDVSLAKLGDENPDNGAISNRVILVGYAHSDFHAEQVLPRSLLDAEEQWKWVSSLRCAVGQRVASTLKMAPGDGVWFRNGPQRYSVTATVLPSTGGPEDNQVFFYLDAVQKLLAQPHHISLIQLSVPGTSEEIVRFVEELQPQLGDAEGHPIRQFTEAQAKIYNRISGILNYTVGIVLVLTGLCVMAAMTNVAMERKNDVGLMKAIGGSVRRVLRLFLAEAALLGLAGGMIGGATGIFLSIGLGKAVFGVAARPRLIVYPVAVALTIIVAILSAYPLRRLASIRPASVFRGEA
ncbi:MAG TPA: ABC transporter permease [Candidatus Acidoferrum sp.]